MKRHYFTLVVAGTGINDAFRDLTSHSFSILSGIMLGLTIILLYWGWRDARRFANSAALLNEAEQDVDDLRARLTKQIKANMVLDRDARFYKGTLRTARDFFTADRDFEGFRVIADALAEDTDTSIKKES